MTGLEIVLNLDTLEIYEVIDHDLVGGKQLDLFESMDLANAS